jgi:hypothetical protein
MTADAALWLEQILAAIDEVEPGQEAERLLRGLIGDRGVRTEG